MNEICFLVSAPVFPSPSFDHSWPFIAACAATTCIGSIDIVVVGRTLRVAGRLSKCRFPLEQFI